MHFNLKGDSFIDYFLYVYFESILIDFLRDRIQYDDISTNCLSLTIFTCPIKDVKSIWLFVTQKPAFHFSLPQWCNLGNLNCRQPYFWKCAHLWSYKCAFVDKMYESLTTANDGLYQLSANTNLLNWITKMHPCIPPMSNQTN